MIYRCEKYSLDISPCGQAGHTSHLVTCGDEDGPVLRARVRLRYIIVILCPFDTVATAAIDNKSRTEVFGNLEPHFYLTWAPLKNWGWTSVCEKQFTPAFHSVLSFYWYFFFCNKKLSLPELTALYPSPLFDQSKIHPKPLQIYIQAVFITWCLTLHVQILDPFASQPPQTRVFTIIENKEENGRTAKP